MNLQINNECFKKTLILFWAVWWLIAFWTDVVGGLAHLGFLHATWAPDANYPFLVDSLKMYSVPDWLVTVFFCGILLWSLLSTVAFFWASLAFSQSAEVWMRRARNAYIISLTFWLALFVADQMIMKFDLEENHMVQGGFELLAFLAMYLLPPEQSLYQ